MSSQCKRFVAAIVAVWILLLYEGNSTAQERALVPDAASEHTAKKAAGEIYGGRFALAKTADEKTALAEEIIAAALKFQAGSADQYALLNIGREIATGVGDARIALSAAQELARRFDLPGLDLEADTLLATARWLQTATQRTSLAELAGEVIGRLVEAREYERAIRLCEAAHEAAEQARNFRQIRHFSNWLPKLKTAQQHFQQYRDALAVLDEDPVEPEANLVAGRYLCFVQGDWELGVPMLALGSDEPLKNASVMELRGAEAAEEQAAIGDAWWDVAEAREGQDRDLLRLRAGGWYRRAAPHLADLAGLRVKQRLEEIAELGPERLSIAYSGTPATKAAVDLGLRWLARQQDMRSGLWSLTGPYANGGGHENKLAATAMALLAFKGAGNTHRAGMYQRNVSLGIDVLVRLQNKEGEFVRSGPRNHRLYTQALATIVMCELYRMTQDAKYRASAQKALDYAARIQTPALGGWRYEPRLDTDTSVTSWFVIALHSGLSGGLEVRRSTLNAVKGFLDKATKDGVTYAYQIGREPTVSMTAAALFCRQHFGRDRNDPRMLEGVRLLLKHPIDYQADEDVYYWYYATQAFHNMGGAEWDEWNQAMRERIPARQASDGPERGSWDPKSDRWGAHGGRLYTTCLSIYNLQIYHRRPIYQH